MPQGSRRITDERSASGIRSRAGVRVGALLLLIAAMCCNGGCRTKPSQPNAFTAPVLPSPQALAIEQAHVTDGAVASNPAEWSLPPRTINSPPATEYWDLSLMNAVRLAAKNEVMTSLGALVVDSPASAVTVFDPAVIESDPLYGTQGALSEFDPIWSSEVSWGRNDRGLNNILSGGGVRELEQDLLNYRSGIQKIAATGTALSFQNTTAYDANNGTANLFPSAWDTQWDASVRHPFLQGGGLAFNRIAGPKAAPGFNFSNGVLLARIRTDVSLADFESGVSAQLNAVETAYWDLYLAYRKFEAQTQMRDAALAGWQYIRTRFDQGLPGGESDKEAQAREHFFEMQDQVEAALAGPEASLYSAERRLRMVLGLPQNDGRLIRPADAPAEAKIAFDWQPAVSEAFARRPELRRQKWKIKQRELELIAARNFTLPKLDGVALYRLRGFGDQLAGADDRRFDSAAQDLASLDHQEWQVGMQLNMPLGFRQGLAAVRNAEHALARERALLRREELEVVNQLGEAVAAADQAHSALVNAAFQNQAMREYYAATKTAFEADQIPFEQWTAARTRMAEVQGKYYRNLVAHAAAIKEVHRQKGALLQWHGVLLTEESWPYAAAKDAAELARRWREMRIDYRMVPTPISDGIAPQAYDPPAHPSPPEGEIVPPPNVPTPPTTTPLPIEALPFPAPGDGS